MAKQRDLVDGERVHGGACVVDGLHLERPNGLGDRRCQALGEGVLGILVHQEADGAAVHAVDALARAHGLAQRLQQEAVAAEGHDDVGIPGGNLAVAPAQPFGRIVGLGCARRCERECQRLGVHSFPAGGPDVGRRQRRSMCLDVKQRPAGASAAGCADDAAHAVAHHILGGHLARLDVEHGIDHGAAALAPGNHAQRLQAAAA